MVNRVNSWLKIAAFGLLVSALLLVGRGEQVHAETSFPMIMSVSPIAVQQGTTAEVTVKSRYDLRGTFEVLVSGDGVTAEAVLPEEKPVEGDEKPKELTSLKIRITVAADALPGVRDLRLATPLGCSTLGQWVVVRDPVISEAKDNDTAAKAQEVTLPATLCGAIEKAEDIDCFKFKVEKPGRFTFHLRSGRLEDRIHDLQTHADPIMTLKNSGGTVLAEVDNYFFADPLLSYDFSRAGDYVLEVRDVRYQGNAYWEYSVEASDRPLVTNVFPLTVTPGTKQTLSLIGYGLPENSSLEWQVPADMPPGLHWVSLDETLVAAKSPLAPLGGPVPVVVGELPTFLEPQVDHSEAAASVAVEWPITINGRISTPGEVDLYTITGKAGELLNFEMIARRHQSTIDPVVTITDMDGKTLTENDDFSRGRMSSQDSQIASWKVPKDGQYLVAIRDLHLRGNDGGVYSLSISPVVPGFWLEADTDKTLLTPGTSGAIYVRAYRYGGFEGPIDLHIDGLPDGVEAEYGQIPAKADDGCMILSTNENAQPLAHNVRIWGSAAIEIAKSEDPKADEKKPEGKEETEERATDEAKEVQTLAADATAMQETYMPGGGRGHYPVDMHTLSIGPPLDILSVKLNTYAVKLKPGESAEIEITIERAEGFTENVSLDCMMRHLNRVYGSTLPKGVTIDDKASKTVLRKDECVGKITLKADPKAEPAEEYLVPVMAQTSINFVMKLCYSSHGLRVSVLPADDKVAQK